MPWRGSSASRIYCESGLSASNRPRPRGEGAMPSATMQAMVLERAGTPLRAAELPVPAPSANQVLIKVTACGVCRTDLHNFDGELTQPKLPLVLGHEIIGHVAALGPGVAEFAVG